MELLLRLDGPEPLNRQIYLGLRDVIATGGLRPGDRLPSSRELAGRLSVSRNVVLIAYAQLEAEGYVTGRVGTGTYVSRDLPDPASVRPALDELVAPDASATRLSAFGRRLARQNGAWKDEPTGSARWDFSVGLLADADFPARDWQRSLREAARLARPEHTPPEGLEQLREEVRRYLTVARGVVADIDQILITTGVRQGYDLTLRLLVDQGDAVVVEDPGFPPASAWTRAHGAKLLAVAVDREGIQPEALLAVGAARLAYLTPSHQYPTGAILPMARRLAVLDWATQARCVVFEDDYDAEFQYAVRPIAALQRLKPAAVVYAGSVAKVLSPALRIGYLVLPRDLVDAFRAARRGSDRQTSTLLQYALARFVADGAFARHLRRQRIRYRGRRAALVEAIEAEWGERVVVRGAEAGLQLLVTFLDLPVRREPALIRRAAELDVRIEGAAACYARPTGHASLLLGFAGMSADSIREGVRRIGRAIEVVGLT